MNKEVYIVGGGASLKGFDFSVLKDVDTIAVNMSALDVPDPTYCITADSGILRKLQRGRFDSVDTTWVLVTNPNHASMKWKDGKFTHKSGFVYNLFVVNILIKNAGTDGIGFTFKDFRTGYNSGFCGFQLAVLLGYKKIHLLGFDLSNSEDRQHYHDRYNNAKTTKDETFKKFRDNFLIALKIIKEKTDIKVISHSPISELNKAIPYIPLKQLTNNPNKASSEPVQASKGITRIISPKTAIKPLQGTQGAIRPRLSILICTLTNRQNLLERLLKVIGKQDCKEIEILVESDDGQMTIGAKRNKLLHRSTGDYIAFIDDDDLVSENYVSKILKALKSNPDCCGIEGTIHNEKKGWSRKFIHSIKYNKWYDKNDGTNITYFRCPNHLSPVKRQLALATMFPEKDSGEDRDYSMRLRPLIKVESYIKGSIYSYFTGKK